MQAQAYPQCSFKKWGHFVLLQLLYISEHKNHKMCSHFKMIPFVVLIPRMKLAVLTRWKKVSLVFFYFFYTIWGNTVHNTSHTSQTSHRTITSIICCHTSHRPCRHHVLLLALRTSPCHGERRSRPCKQHCSSCVFFVSTRAIFLWCSCWPRQNIMKSVCQLLFVTRQM